MSAVSDLTLTVFAEFLEKFDELMVLNGLVAIAHDTNSFVGVIANEGLAIRNGFESIESTGVKGAFGYSPIEFGVGEGVEGFEF